MSLAIPSNTDRLNGALTIVPHQLARSHAKKESLWNFAKAADVFGYMGLSASAFIGTAIFFPHMILPVTLGVFVAMPTAVKGFQYADNAAAEHMAQKNRNERIAEIQAELDSLSHSELRYRFAQAGIDESRIDDYEGGLSELTTGLATLLYLCEATHSLFEKYQESLAALKTESISSYRTLLMREAHSWGRAALASRIHASYMHGLLHHPLYQKTLDDIGTLTNVSPENYALESLYARKPSVFVFKDDTSSPLEENDLDIQDNILEAPVYADFSRGVEAISRLGRQLFDAVT